MSSCPLLSRPVRTVDCRLVEPLRLWLLTACRVCDQGVLTLSFYRSSYSMRHPSFSSYIVHLNLNPMLRNPLHFHTTPMPRVKCCGPFGFPWSLCNCPPGSLTLLQTQPSFSLLSPSTNLRRHKHGTSLATVFRLKETLTMVGALSLLQCFCG